MVEPLTAVQKVIDCTPVGKNLIFFQVACVADSYSDEDLFQLWLALLSTHASYKKKFQKKDAFNRGTCTRKKFTMGQTFAVFAVIVLLLILKACLMPMTTEKQTLDNLVKIKQNFEINGGKEIMLSI